MFRELFRDISELLSELLKKLISSRLFALSVIFTLMFSALICKLFSLQIIEGDEHQYDYIQKTKRTVAIPSTRGNIYDRNGKLLAYNDLAYNVTVQDVGEYKGGAMNAMLLRLIAILDEHGESVQGKFEVVQNSNGEMEYSSVDEYAKKGFLRDLYGLKSRDELDDAKGKYPSTVTARELFEKKKAAYNLDELKDADGNPVDLPDELALKVINIRYTMSLTQYKKYEATTVASHISNETMAEILENAEDLKGVNVEEGTVRVYEDSVYFAPIIGYTGKMPEEKLEELRKSDESYDLNDTVGRIGIEADRELQLQGKKGSRTMFVDNMGRTLEVTEEVEPIAGHDIYLTIDHDLQVGIYRLLEQQLAGVVASKLVNQDAGVNDKADSSDRKIPIKDAYFQLVNNNVLSLSRMASDEATDIEKEINGRFLASREPILNSIRNELMSAHPVAIKDLPEDMAAYMDYIYQFLSDSSVGIIQRRSGDAQSQEQSQESRAWDGREISLREYIYAGIAGSWIDTTKLEGLDKYSSADATYEALVNYVLEELKNDSEFSKEVYRFLINGDVITGRDLCLALYAQGVLPYDEAEIQKLTAGGSNYAYTFLVKKVSDIEITPAQLALEPCTAGCVVTDVNTGEVRALVTYPSYDNNRLSGTVDGAYYSQLNDDNSRPLWNNATQVSKAPGSTFKPITAIAGLEEHVISLTDRITCTGVYKDVEPPIKCWIAPSAHGSLDVVGGIGNSCNYFFSDVAHRLSTDGAGVYNSQLGVNRIRKYAKMFGLDHTSGVEISEQEPKMTTEAPERSAMGQGTNAYANIQLSRYVAALANRGTVFELSLLDKETDSEGNLIQDYTPKIYSQIKIADSTWDAVHEGMRQVVANGSARSIFKDLEVEIAGKTGTAQESKVHANHAFFISYAPYANPEICVTVNIPNGYSSSNAATVAKNVYRFYYEYMDLDYIMNNGALDVADVKIVD